MDSLEIYFQSKKMKKEYLEIPFMRHKTFFTPIAFRKLLIRERRFLRHQCASFFEEQLGLFMGGETTLEQLDIELIKFCGGLKIAEGDRKKIADTVLLTAKIWEIPDLVKTPNSDKDIEESNFQFKDLLKLNIFCMTLQIFRKINIFVLSDESFSVLVTMIERSLDFCVLEKQIKYPIEMLLMCSTYYKLDGKGKRYYLKEEIKNHEIFGFYEFWHSSLLYFVSKTIKRNLLS